jgi:predicted  nucleic acid-binding Zn-ribbon protein
VSFLVASGHVQVDANTRDAKDKIEDLVRSLSGVNPSAQAAATALKDLGKRAVTAGQNLGRMGERAEDAERALAGLRAVAGDIRVKAELADETTAGVAGVKAAIADLKAQSPVRLEVNFSGDATQIAASAQAMRDLRNDSRDTGQSLNTLTVRAAAAAAALNELEQQAQDASRALRTLRGRAAATAAAMADLRDTTSRAATALRSITTRADTADGRFNTLSDRTRTLRGDMDDLDGSLRRVGGSLGALRPRVGGLGSSSGDASGGMQKLMLAAIGLSTALIPIAAATVPIIAGTAAAGAGITAFAVAIGQQVTEMAKASDATSKYEDAVRDNGRGSEEAAKAARQAQIAMAQMPPATQQAAASLGVLKDEYEGWSDALAGDTMPVVTKSLGLFQAMLPHLTPTVRGVSAELQNLQNVAAGGMQTAGFERFMNKLAEWSSGALARATMGMVQFSQALDSGAVGSDVNEFMDYVRANGPLVADTLGNLARAAIHLVVAASDMGVSVLGVVNVFAKLVNAIPTSVLSTMLQLYAALKLVSVGVGLLSAAASSGAVARLAAYFAVMRAAGVSTTLRATAASMTAVQKASLGLGVLAIGAIAIDKLADTARGAPPDVDRLTTSLKTLATTGKFAGELRASFGSLEGLAEDFKKLSAAQQEVAHQQSQMSQTELFNFKNRTNPVGDWFWGMIDDFQKGGESAKALEEKFGSLDEALARLASSGYGKQAAQDFEVIRNALRADGWSDAKINETFDNYKAAVADLKAEQQLAAQGMGLFGQQAMATKAKLDAQKASADGLRASILALNDVNRSAYDSQIAFEQAIDDLSAAFKENGNSLDISTEAGRKNGQAMSAAAKAHDEMIAAGLAAGESLGSMTSKSDQLRAKMMQLATATLGSKDKAREYVNTLLGAPGEIKTVVKLERQEAITGLQAVQAEIRKTPGAKTVTVSTLNAAAIKALEAVGLKTRQLPDGRTQVYTANGQAIGSIGAVSKALSSLNGRSATTYVNNIVTTTKRSVHEVVGGYKRASGGPIRLAAGGTPGGRVAGAGTSTSDSIPAMLSDGEWVIQAAAVEKYGDAFMAAVNDGRLSLPGFAKGGKLTEKQKAELQRKKEARGYLTANTTLTDMSHIAGVQNAEISSKLGKERSEGALVDFLNQLQTQVSKAGFSKGTNAALQKQITSSAKKLFALNDQYDKVTASLEKAKGSLEDLKGKFDNLKTSVASSLVGFGNITKLGKYGTSADTLINQLRSDTGRTTEFAKQLEQLKAKGLNATAISNIAQAGVTGGGMATAQSLLNATPEQIAEINALQKQLEASANKAGTVTADAMYGAGIKAAEGLVKGLTAQQSAIEAAMMTIAKAMEKSIKKALGIKSPAKVMEPIGDFAFQGVEAGWVKRMAQGNTLLTGSTAGLRTKPTMLRAAVPAATAAGAAPSVNLTATFNTMTLPAPAERKAFAVAMAKDINDALLDYQKGRRR